MDKDVLLGVVSVDEAIAALDVEPLDSARDLAGDDLLRFFLISVGGRWIGIGRGVGLRLCRLSLRVGHDGRWSV